MRTPLAASPFFRIGGAAETAPLFLGKQLEQFDQSDDKLGSLRR